jgi:hypothetical protein
MLLDTAIDFKKELQLPGSQTDVGSYDLKSGGENSAAFLEFPFIADSSSSFYLYTPWTSNYNSVSHLDFSFHRWNPSGYLG